MACEPGKIKMSPKGNILTLKPPQRDQADLEWRLTVMGRQWDGGNGTVLDDD